MKAGSVKRVLLLMIQPPGGTGVQGLRYAKLFPHTLGGEWELHFAGPDPRLTSVGLEPLVCPASHCHYSRNISASLRFATLKNRQSKYSPLYFFFGLLQLLSLRLESWLGHDSFAYLQRGLQARILRAERQYGFDLIAAKSPDFRILELGAALARQLGKPLLAIYDDPHGQRDALHFYPDDRERQLLVLQQAAGVLFMSPLTRDRYVQQHLVERAKTFCLTDSYPLEPGFYRHPPQTSPTPPLANPAPTAAASTNPPVPTATLRLVHLGNLPEWRPIDPLLQALASLEDRLQPQCLQIDFYGYLYPRAQELIHGLPQAPGQLSIHIHAAVDHLHSHHVAAQADILLVMIGPRHLDNQPSKFFVYLGHHKPVLVIGPPGNPIQALVEQLGIGLFCDVHNPLAIRDGLLEIVHHYPRYQAAFARRIDGIQRFGADAVAADFLAVLDATLEHSLQSG